MDKNTEEIKSIILNKASIYKSEIIDYDTIKNAKVSVEDVIDFHIRGFILRLRMDMLALKTHKIEIHRQYPADWWQAFKERWFPHWVLQRFPVEYSYIDIEEDRFLTVCPHLSAPEEVLHINYLAGIPELDKYENP